MPDFLTKSGWKTSCTYENLDKKLKDDPRPMPDFLINFRMETNYILMNIPNPDDKQKTYARGNERIRITNLHSTINYIEEITA